MRTCGVHRIHRRVGVRRPIDGRRAGCRDTIGVAIHPINVFRRRHREHDVTHGRRRCVRPAALAAMRNRRDADNAAVVGGAEQTPPTRAAPRRGRFGGGGASAEESTSAAAVSGHNRFRMPDATPVSARTRSSAYVRTWASTQRSRNPDGNAVVLNFTLTALDTAAPNSRRSRLLDAGRSRYMRCVRQGRP